jgi:hypothetical protein
MHNLLTEEDIEVSDIVGCLSLSRRLKLPFESKLDIVNALDFAMTSTRLDNIKNINSCDPTSNWCTMLKTNGQRVTLNVTFKFGKNENTIALNDDYILHSLVAPSGVGYIKEPRLVLQPVRDTRTFIQVSQNIEKSESRYKLMLSLHTKALNKIAGLVNGSEDLKMFFCSNERCNCNNDGFIAPKDNHNSTNTVICPGKLDTSMSCSTKLCNLCGNAAHPGQFCRGIDPDLAAYLATGNTKPCSRCNMAIERTSGCDHMTCIQCMNHFCWVCSVSYPTSDEFYNRHGSQCRRR